MNSTALSGAAAESNPRPCIRIIQDIQKGTLDATTLSLEERRAVVEHLWSLGYSVAEMAGLLQVSDRTIKRDRAFLRGENAQLRELGFVSRAAGQLIWQTELAASQLRRVARDAETAPRERVAAILAAAKVVQDTTKLLQSMGYVPQFAAQKVEVAGAAPVHDPTPEQIGEAAARQWLEEGSDTATRDDAARQIVQYVRHGREFTAERHAMNPDDEAAYREGVRRALAAPDDTTPAPADLPLTPAPESEGVVAEICQRCPRFDACEYTPFKADTPDSPDQPDGEAALPTYPPITLANLYGWPDTPLLVRYIPG